MIIDLSEADLSFAELGSANLSGANLEGASLISACLNNADLRGADFEIADLKAADLSSTDCTGAKLRNSRHANLSDVNISCACLREADLEGTNLSWANLTQAILNRAKLTGVNLFETVFGDTDLTDTVGLDACFHEGPSTLDHRTIAKSGHLPLAFLRGCGLPDRFIDYLPSLFNETIQFYSCFISYSAKDQEFADQILRRPSKQRSALLVRSS